jgi:hypoxanthine phosphoribosyltransferase
MTRLLANRIQYYMAIGLHRGRTDLSNMKIVPIPRGGYIPAVILSHQLRLSVCPLHLSMVGDSDCCIVVDDICDTGKTFKETRAVLPHALYASLVTKPEGSSFCHISVQEIPQDMWAVFPWEDPDEIPNR